MFGASPDVSARPRWAAGVAAVAILFGVVTVLSGGAVLFGGSAVGAAAGDAVPFVLWFNFVSGFAYVLAGAGLVLWRRWAAWLSAAIAVATVLVFAAFGWHVASGVAFEMRTVGAMVLRSGTWIAIAAVSCRALGCLASKRAAD